MSSSVAVDRSVQNETVSETVVSAVADLMGEDPCSLEPLFHTVDPEALNGIFDGNPTDSGRSPARVEFTYCDCDVLVSADGTVRVSRSGREISQRWG